jgi:hypothetical protein
MRFDYDPLFSALVPTLVVLVIAFFLLKKKSACWFEPEFGQMKLWCYTFEYP